MAVNTQETDTSHSTKRFLTLDLSRGLCIIIMIILHMIGDTLNIDNLLADINNIPLINLIALVILPFLGGLAGFFLLISAAGNMVSMYKDLNKGVLVRGIVLKQVIGGFVLLIFAMFCEGLTGYHGAFGNLFLSLNNPSNTNWKVLLFNWNVFETVHTIAWCLIINGCVQGLLSLRGNWQNTNRMIIAYAILIVVVISWTQPVWDLVSLVGPGYPFALYSNGHMIYQPWIGDESFWDILRAPFLAPLAAPMEPLFPYLAVSFFGSIIGILLSQPKEKVSKNIPRNIFLVGLTMFIAGLIGIVFILMQIMSATYITADSFDVTIAFYRLISFHRHWAPDAANIIFGGETVIVPPFSWLAQFSALNGLSIMMLMFLFRFIEFRGKSKIYANRTKIIRRFGIVAFSNYNNQWIYYIPFLLVSIMLFKFPITTPYTKLTWGGTFLAILITLIIFSLILWGWEKIKYTGSLEWFIRTFTANVVPVRRSSFDKKIKWWQKGQIDVNKTFYNAQWVEFDDLDERIKQSEMLKAKSGRRESKFGLILSLVGLFSILFMILSIVAVFISINARKIEGKNRINLTAFILSIIGCVLFVGLIITAFIVPIGLLGLF